jgi:hypothetical protein
MIKSLLIVLSFTLTGSAMAAGIDLSGLQAKLLFNRLPEVAAHKSTNGNLVIEKRLVPGVTCVHTTELHWGRGEDFESTQCTIIQMDDAAVKASVAQAKPAASDTSDLPWSADYWPVDSHTGKAWKANQDTRLDHSWMPNVGEN